MRVDAEDYLPRERLAELRRISAMRSLGAIAFTWACIIACFWAYAAVGPISLLASWFVMSGRHLALAILMHDGAHGLLLRNKGWNDRIGRWLMSYPMLADMSLYRAIHFQHHRHTWTERDPDLGLATDLPITRASFRRKMLRDLSGQTAYVRYRIIWRHAAGLDPVGRGLEGKSLGSVLREFAKNERGRGFLITHTLLLGALILSGIPEAYLLVWWLPSWTGFSVVLRLRSITEHSCIGDPSDPLRNARTTLVPGWLRFFVAPHHVNYHLEHHLFMTVPHYNLPRAHRLLREAGKLQGAEVAPSYFSVLRTATSKPELATLRCQ
jgi:fatty acid desaturase